MSKSHWVLLTRDVIPGSRDKSFAEQQKLLPPAYEAPKLLEMTVAIFFEYVQRGKRLYSTSPLTYTRCQEKGSWRQMAVGDFSAAGLHVLYRDIGEVNDFDGVAGCRKFWDFASWILNWDIVWPRSVALAIENVENFGSWGKL